MDTRKLRYLVAIAEEGSMSAAAQRLNVAQPSLSQHVMALERDLGVELMVRTSRGISLTQAGDLLVERARDILRQLEEARVAVSQCGAVPKGPVSMGLPPSISMVLAVPLSETIRVELPEVKLQAVEGMSGFIKGWLDNQTVEMGFVYDLDGLRFMRVHHLLDEHLSLLSAPDTWPLSSPPGEPVTLAQVQALELILPSQRHGLRVMVEKIARAHNCTLNVVLELDAMTQIKELVARGSGYTILSPAAANDSLARGDLVHSTIIEPRLTRPVYLVRRSGGHVSPACREVERLTVEVTRDLVARGIWEGTMAAARVNPVEA